MQRPVVATQEPPVQETATAPAEEAEPEEPEQAQQAEEPPEPDDMPMLVEAVPSKRQGIVGHPLSSLSNQ